MTDRPSIPNLLDRLERIAQSVMDAPAPIGPDGVCTLCFVHADQGHDEDECGWLLARKLAPSDLEAIRRLARALRYGPGVSQRDA